MAIDGTRIQRMLDRQGEALARLDEDEARRFLRAFEDARRALAERLRTLEGQGLDEKTPWTAQHLRVTLVQVEAGIRQVEERLKVQLDETTRAHRERAMKDLLQVLGRADPAFADVGQRLELDAIGRLAKQDGLLLHRYSIDRYGRELVDAVQRELVLSTTAAMTWRQVVGRLTDPEKGVLAGMRGRAELIVRMESSRAYNDGHQAGLEQAAALLDEPGRPDPLMKRADEYSDRRNHPLSRALHGRLAPIKGEWQVPVAEVEAWGRALKKSTGGIVWRKEGGFWVGGAYPAHFNDRGRMTPWRASWGDPGAMPAPQGAARQGPPVHVGRQAKHILGKGYIKGRSILSADPEYLAQWVGKGRQAGQIPVGQPGSKERIDFGFVIGNWHEHDGINKRVVQRHPTTMGIIHYSKTGIHIVPATPAEW